MSDHEPPHDGPEEPLPEPELPELDSLVTLTRPIYAASPDGLVKADLPEGLTATYRGDAGDGQYEISVAIPLHAFVPPDAFRPIDQEEGR